MGQHHAEDQGEGALDRGLAHVLPHDLDLLRAEDLPQSHLLGPRGRTADGQVHEVDAGDEEDEQRRADQDIGQVGVAREPHSETHFRVQVHPGYGLQDQLRRCVRRVMRFHECRQLGLERSGPVRTRKFDERLRGVVTPLADRIGNPGDYFRHDGDGHEQVEPDAGIGRGVLRDAGDGQQRAPGEELPAQRTVRAEVLPGGGAADHHGIRIVQRRRAVAFDQRKGEHLEEGRVAEQRVLLQVPVFADADFQFPVQQPDGPVHDRILPLQGGGERHGGFRGGERVFVETDAGGDHPVQPAGLLVKGVVGPFVPHEQIDEEAARDAYGQAQRVDEEVALVAEEVPQRDEEVVLQHGRYVSRGLRIHDGRRSGETRTRREKGIYGFDPPIPSKVAYWKLFLCETVVTRSRDG